MSDRSSGDGPLTVLAVEDNGGSLRLIEEAFADVDCAVECVVATDGVEAFDALYQQGVHEETPRPDVILLDLDLPRKSGQEVLDDLQDHDRFGGIPVVVLSQNEERATVENCLRLGAEEYHVKPADYEEMLDTVSGLCDRWAVS